MDPGGGPWHRPCPKSLLTWDIQQIMEICIDLVDRLKNDRRLGCPLAGSSAARPVSTSPLAAHFIPLTSPHISREKDPPCLRTSMPCSKRPRPCASSVTRGSTSPTSSPVR